jgi:hypothetical protein
MTDRNPHREYLRHALDVPLQIKLLDEVQPSTQGLNVSHGGLAFSTDTCPPLDHIIQLRIPTVHPPFEAEAQVKWCKRENGKYLVGAQFLNADDAFQSRMVQQVCAIEQYRKDVKQNEGRELNAQQAAAEWISKYASRFPDGSAIK